MINLDKIQNGSARFVSPKDLGFSVDDWFFPKSKFSQFRDPRQAYCC